MTFGYIAGKHLASTKIQGSGHVTGHSLAAEAGYLLPDCSQAGDQLLLKGKCSCAR